MTLEYTTSSKDYLALLNNLLKNSILGKTFSNVAWILISILAWTSVLLPYLKFHEIGIGFWTRGIMAIVITIGWPFFYKKYNQSVFAGIVNEKSVKRLAGITFLKISDAGIEVLTEATHVKSTWDQLYMIEVNRDYIFIYFTPLLARPVPMAAFRSPEEKHLFLKQMRSYKKFESQAPVL